MLAACCRPRNALNTSARHLLGNVSNTWRPSVHQASNNLTQSRETGSVAGAGFLAGKTIAVKDNIVTSFLPTTASSNILDGYVSPFDATVVRQLRDAGAEITAKTSLDEFGMGSHSQSAYTGSLQSPFTRNGEALSPGGSSGGSAVAVAKGEAWAALGTDTGGSVRLPAAYCGIVGFKPSYGLLSRWGVIQYANSLDTVGIIAGNVSDVEKVLKPLNVYDSNDPTSLAVSLRERLSTGARASEHKLRIGVPTEYNIKELSPEVRQTWTGTLSLLKKAGHSLVSVSLPTTQQALSAYYVLAPAEASSNLAKYDGIRYGRRTSGADASPDESLPLYGRTRGEGFGDEVRRRILLGAYALSSEAIDNYFIQAQKIRRLVQQGFDRIFSRPNPLLDASQASGDEGVDVLITPTAPTLPPTLVELKRQTPVESYMLDVFTVPASLAGLPALSVPAPLSSEVTANMDDSDVKTVGMQVVGQFGADGDVLEVGKLLEEMYKSQ